MFTAAIFVFYLRAQKIAGEKVARHFPPCGDNDTLLSQNIAAE